MKVLGMGSETVCWVQGPNHRTQDEVSMLVQYGEIEQLGPARPVGRRPGMVEIPYRRLAPAGTAARRRRRSRMMIFGGAAGVYSLAVLWAAWEARYIVAMAVGALLVVGGVLAVVRALSGSGCPGVHIPGCRCKS